MFLLITGATLVLLGLFCGAVLVLVPLGLASWSAGITIWILFPVFSIAGFILFVLEARTAHIRGLMLAMSGLLLVLALACAISLVLDAASVIHLDGGTLSLWYVFAVAGVLGIASAATNRIAGAEK
jgi:hypothetical protein